MQKRILAFLSVLALMVSLMAMPAAAATTTTKLIPTNIPTKFPVVKMDPSYTLVNFWSSMSGANGVTVNEIVNWFNSTTGKAKKIYVKGVFQGSYDDIAVKVQATIQAGNGKSLPDIALLAPQGAFSLKESKYIVYMEDMMASDKTFTIKDKLNKNNLNACSYKGRQMGLPFANSALVLHYNVNAYKAAGLDPNSPPKTMAELAETCKKLVIKSTAGKVTRYGCTYKMDGTNIATWVTRQKGGKGAAFQFDNEDGRTGTPKTYICATDGTLKATLTEWKKVVDTGTVDIKTSSGTANFQMGMTAQFMASMVGYASVESYFSSIKDKSKIFEHKMARLPSVNADDGTASHVGGSAMYMFERGDATKKAATWQFVKFLASTDVAAYWAVQSGYYALNSDALNTKYMQDAFKADPNSKGIYDIQAASAMNVKAQAPMIPNSGVYVNTVGDQAYLFNTGKQTIDKTVENIAKKENSILKTWWDANS